MKKFHARCNLRQHKPEKALTPEERQEAKSGDYPRIYNRNLAKPRWEVAFPQCEGFETDDPALFDAHMDTAHSRKPIRGENASLINAARGTWRGPRLTEEGTAFQPQDLEPGATVTWRELVPTGEFREERYSFAGETTVQQVPIREWVERSGQVWSAGSYPKSAWVIPFELLEGELAVCVRRDRHDSTLRHVASSTTAGYRDAA